MSERTRILALFAVIGAVSVFFAVKLQDSVKTRIEETKNPTFSSFRVEGANGPVALTDFAGKVVVLYFGYASCPDVCPTTLSIVGQAFQRLSPAEQDRVAGMFVSVDPERDTIAHVDEYARFFHPNIVGGTASVPEVTAAATDWGIGFQKVAGTSAIGYTVDHTSILFVIDTQGHMVKALPHGSDASRVEAAIREVLTKNTRE